MKDIRTLDDLPRLSTLELQAFVRQGVLSLSRAASDRDKVSAFRPAVLSLARTEDIVASVGGILQAAFPKSEAKLAEAVAAALESWAPLADGVTGAALLIRLCVYLGAARLEEAIENFLLKPETRLLEPSDALSSTLANASRERLSRRGARRVAVLGRQAGAISDKDVVRVAAFVAGDQIGILPAMLVELGLPSALDFDLAARWMVLSLCEYCDRAGLVSRMADLRPASSEEEERAIDWVLMAAARLDREEEEEAKEVAATQLGSSLTSTDAKINEFLLALFPDALEISSDRKMKMPSFLGSRDDVSPDQDSTDPANVIDFGSLAHAAGDL